MSQTLLAIIIQLVEVFLKLAIELQKLINPDNIQIIVITMGSKGSIYIAKIVVVVVVVVVVKPLHNSLNLEKLKSH